MATSSPSLSDSSFQELLSKIQPTSTGWNAVSRTWGWVLEAWLPVGEDYESYLKVDNVSKEGKREDVTLLHVKIEVDPQHPEENCEYQLMVVKCKGPVCDTQELEDTLKSQLLSELQQSRNRSRKLFGAVATGKKIRFYRYDGNAIGDDMMLPLHQGALDLDKAGDLLEVEKIMHYIKANAREWAVEGSLVTSG